jgi:isopentenyl-diphosphate delta-isomerase
MNLTDNLAQRKQGHLELAQKAQMALELQNRRFDYEPLFAAHPTDWSALETSFLGKTLKAPLWISSMTGGTARARELNQLLAKAAATFGLGMGLGSCRPLLSGSADWSDFDLRGIIGDGLPLYANLGIAQIEQLLEEREVTRAHEMVARLQADGLIIHLNPLQEWFQPEGDRLKRPAIETLTRFLEIAPYPVIVKEVGQGMGPTSLRALISLPFAAIEFGAFGGTNFSKLEWLRDRVGERAEHLPLTQVGHGAEEMLLTCNQIYSELGERALCRSLIISGGIQDFLQGDYLVRKSAVPAVVGRANAFLQAAERGEGELFAFVRSELDGVALSRAFLSPKE